MESTVTEAITEATQAATEVIEVVEENNCLELLGEIIGNQELILQAVQLIAGFALFLVVVCLCYFCYKFFRIFF